MAHPRVPRPRAHLLLLLALAVTALAAAALAAPVEHAVPGSELQEAGGSDGCNCRGHQCDCCVFVDISAIHFKEEICVNMTYIPSTLTASLTVEVNHKVVYNRTVSLLNPDVCFKVPLLPTVDICVDFYNVSVTPKEVSGCAKLVFKVLSKTIAEVKLGCFRFPVVQQLPALPPPFVGRSRRRVHALA